MYLGVPFTEGAKTCTHYTTVYRGLTVYPLTHLVVRTGVQLSGKCSSSTQEALVYSVAPQLQTTVVTRVCNRKKRPLSVPNQADRQAESKAIIMEDLLLFLIQE